MTEVSLARRVVRAAREVRSEALPEAVRAKVKLALIDYLSCVFESLELPQSVCAIERARRMQGGGATVIGANLATNSGEAAFVNAVLGHGLVREDMHIPSVSHLGTVIFPALLAMSETRSVSGRDFVAGAVTGYEVGGAIGRALMDAETVRIFRPTGITGPIGAAAGLARMLSLSEGAAVSTIALAANTTAGLNEWPRYGADDMYFHVGFAARNAVTSVELAELGAHGSETALDGAAGLFAALRRLDRVKDVRPFEREHLELMEVFHKPAGACNYAQTATQAAVALARESDFDSRDIAAVRVMCTASALNYPGCAEPGPFPRVLAAKMSIRYCVAAALKNATAAESNFRDLNDPEIARLVAATSLEEDPELTRAYPAAQGAEVVVTLRDGRELRRRLKDLTAADDALIRDRFAAAAEAVLGRATTAAISSLVANIEQQTDVGELGRLLGAQQVARV